MERKLTWRKKLRYTWLTAFAYSIYGFFRAFPVDAASAIGGWLMERIGPRMKHDKTARDNLAAAFPDKTQEERDAILRGMWNNLGRVIAEYPHLHHIWKNVEFPEPNYFAAAAAKGGPCIFFGGHIANWEIQPIGAKKSGLPIHLVYRKPNNPWVDSLLRHARDSAADGHIAKGREGAREILSVLKKGGAVGMLVDQKLNEGIAVPFFGRDAMTAEAIAHFALRFDCPLYPAYIERLGGCRFRLNTLPPLVVKKTGDKKADVRAVMVEINSLLETWIRARPEQWLWVHNRWPKEGG